MGVHTYSLKRVGKLQKKDIINLTTPVSFCFVSTCRLVCHNTVPQKIIRKCCLTIQTTPMISYTWDGWPHLRVCALKKGVIFCTYGIDLTITPTPFIHGECWVCPNQTPHATPKSMVSVWPQTVSFCNKRRYTAWSNRHHMYTSKSERYVMVPV